MTPNDQHSTFKPVEEIIIFENIKYCIPYLERVLTEVQNKWCAIEECRREFKLNGAEESLNKQYDWCGVRSAEESLNLTQPSLLISSLAS